MATTTENLGLTLPAGTDRALVSDLNENFQALDTFAGQATADIQEAQETADAAAPQSTTYTKTEVDTALAEKVDKETGKGLSANDFTDTDKAKLDGIESGAEVNVQADWTQTDTSADDYIKNKPTIPSPVTVDQTYSAASTNAQSGVAVAQAISTKVDKVTGKGLSTNDFTDADKANLTTALETANAAAPQSTTYTKSEVDTALAEKISHELAVPDGSILEYADRLSIGFYTARQGYGTGSDKPVADEGYFYLISVFSAATAQIAAFTSVKQGGGTVPNIYTAVKNNGTWGPWYKFEGTAVT